METPASHAFKEICSDYNIATDKAGVKKDAPQILNFVLEEGFRFFTGKKELQPYTQNPNSYTKREKDKKNLERLVKRTVLDILGSQEQGFTSELASPQPSNFVSGNPQAKRGKTEAFAERLRAAPNLQPKNQTERGL
jgi:hypothetical protein